MARRRRNSHTVSLFPFLSILACVIGVLTLLITAMALGQLDPREVEAAELLVRVQQTRDSEFREVTEQTEEDRKEAERLRQMIKEAEMVRQQLQSARDELDKLTAERNKQLSMLVGGQKNSAELLSEANRMRIRIAELEPELHSLMEQIKRIKAELAERQREPEEATVTIRPSGSGTDRAPSFVECTAGGIIIHTTQPPTYVRRGDLAKSKPYLDLLDHVALNDETKTVIFLLREDGLETYYVARGIAISRSARNGKLPVLGQGKLDLSLFNEVIENGN